MHEMPDLFKIENWWYHIVTEYSDRSKMIYRMSKSLEGPWIAPLQTMHLMEELIMQEELLP